VNVSGIPGKQYELILWNSGQIANVEGGKLIQDDKGQRRIRVELPGTDSSSYVHGRILIQFTAEGGGPNTREKPR